MSVTCAAGTVTKPAAKRCRCWHDHPQLCWTPAVSSSAHSDTFICRSQNQFSSFKWNILASNSSYSYVHSGLFIIPLWLFMHKLAHCFISVRTIENTYTAAQGCIHITTPFTYVHWPNMVVSVHMVVISCLPRTTFYPYLNSKMTELHGSDCTSDVVWKHGHVWRIYSILSLTKTMQIQCITLWKIHRHWRAHPHTLQLVPLFFSFNFIFSMCSFSL